MKEIRKSRFCQLIVQCMSVPGCYIFLCLTLNPVYSCILCIPAKQFSKIMYWDGNFSIFTFFFNFYLYSIYLITNSLYSQIFSSFCLRTAFLKVRTLEQLHWLHLARKANSQSSPKIYWIRNSGGRAQQSVFNQALWWFWYTIKLANHWWRGRFTVCCIKEELSVNQVSSWLFNSRSFSSVRIEIVSILRNAWSSELLLLTVETHDSASGKSENHFLVHVYYNSLT